MENLNSVCYVAKIVDIKPIEGADNIELAIANGWNCITKKGEYKVEDLVIIATTDAVIPEKLSDSMGVTSYLRKGQRVRTVKLRGVYSECLIIPFSYLDGKATMGDWNLGLGSDCMNILDIYKYEPPVKMVQLASGKKIRYQDNPNFQVYYKFPNAKNAPDMFTSNDFVQVTRKIHGTNARYGIVKKTKLSLLDRLKKLFGNKWIEYEFVVGSHNVEKGSDSQGFYDTNVWYEVADKYFIKEQLWNYVKAMYSPSMLKQGIVIYGEIYGPGIQKGYDYGLKELRLDIFDIMIDGVYEQTWSTESIVEVFFKRPGVDHAQVLYGGFYNKDIIQQFIHDTIEGTKIPHEGIVVKHQSGQRNKIFKVINPEYLIYSEKHNVGESH